MKFLKYLSPVILSLVFSACETDLETVTYDPDQVKPATLHAINSEYTLDPLKSGEPVFTLQWAAAEVGFDASITYNVEIDLSNKNFGQKQIVASVMSTTEVEIKTSELNNAVNKLIKQYQLTEGEAQECEIRLASSISDATEGFYSNVIQTRITPFAGAIDYPKVWVVGTYSGWGDDGWDNEQHLYDFNGNNTFDGWIFFDGKASQGFKITGEAGWSNGNWGSPAGATAEAPSLILLDGSMDNITAYSKNYYRFSFNKTTLELKKVAGIDALGIIGDGANGWGDNDDILMDFDPETQCFTTIATLKDGSIKFRGDHTYGDVNLGYKSDGLLEQGASTNITVQAGTYKITLNLNNPEEMTYKMEPVEALDPAKITAPALDNHADIELAKTGQDNLSWSELDFGGQTPTAVTYVAEMDLAGADFANAQVLGTTKDNVTTLSLTGEQYLTALTALGKNSDEACDVEIRVKATAMGIKDPFISNTVAYKVTINTAAALPEEMYINGSFNAPNWDWADARILQLIPVHSHPGKFWGIYYFDANTEIKFSPVKDWQGDFGCADGDAHDYGTIPVGTNNLKLANSGFYQIVITCSLSADGKSVEKQIELLEPKVYVIGDCAQGGWDAQLTDTDLFTLQGDEYVSPALFHDGNLRICIRLEGCDWWNTEFNIYDGEIVFRGTGGDQAAVTATAGQVVKLNFKTNTGVIE